MESNSKCASLDTNIIIRLITLDNKEQHKLALDLVLNGRNYYVDDYAVMESVYVLEKQEYSRKDIVESLQTLLNNQSFIYNESLFAPIFEKYLTHPSLSFNDCVLEARSEKKGAIPLWTFDQKFARQSDVARLLTY